MVGVDNYIVDRHFVVVVALYAPCPCIPDLNCAILGAGNHPFTLAVEGYACDVAGVAIEGEHRARVRRAYVVELDIVVAGCGKETLVGGDAEAVYLGVGVLDGAGADARESFPEADRVVIASCTSC